MSQSLSSTLRSTADTPAVPREVRTTPGLDRAPFRWTQRDRDSLPVHVRGSVPAWLSGHLVRTAPALFEQQRWHASHWFDGLALIYGFRFGEGRVTFRQRLLQSEYLKELSQGKDLRSSFGTRTSRGLVHRVLHPTPKVTDNANVNIVPWQGQWLAMTETEHQHVIDDETLATRGHYKYDDEKTFPSGAGPTAHPHYDFENNVLVNMATRFGPKIELIVYHQRPNENKRVIEGRLSFARAPYVHDFGMSARHVVLIDHPLRQSALPLLFSNRALLDAAKWEARSPTRLWKLDRKRGDWTVYETEPLFCFHTVNTYDDGDDVVMDFLAFDDARVVEALRTRAFRSGELPAFLPRYVRARLSPGRTHAELTTLSSERFDFPNIPYLRQHGRRYDTAWGVALGGSDWESGIVRVNVDDGQARHFREPGMVYGEPVFAPRPGAQDPREGVVLALGSHLHADRATLVVLDAISLQPLAHCDIDGALPLGFHGTFHAR